MARGRFISESVAKDKRLNELSIEAELVYLMTIPHLDRDGLIDGDPDTLWGTVCPKRRVLLDRIPDLIAEWVKKGLVLRYDAGEDPVLWFVGFTKNQQGLRYDRETPSAYPAPPGFHRNGNGIAPDDDKGTPAPPAPVDDNPPDESGKMPENSNKSTPRAHAGARAEVQVEVKDQVKDQPPPPTPSASPSQPNGGGGDDEIEAVLECWRQNMPCEIVPVLEAEIKALVRKTSGRSVIHGITTAVNNDRKTYGYAASVAQNHFDGRPPPKPAAGGTGLPPGYSEHAKRKTLEELASKPDVTNRRILTNEEHQDIRQRDSEQAQERRKQQLLQQQRKP